jgi:hypothetical protein
MKQVTSAEVWLDDFGSVFANRLRIVGFEDKSRTVESHTEATHAGRCGESFHSFQLGANPKSRADAAA